MAEHVARVEQTRLMLKLRWKNVIGRQKPDSSDLDDEDLVQRARENTDEFSELYRRHAPEIQRFVRSKVIDPMLAEDITRMVFTKAMQALPRYTKSPFRAWLYRITRNTTIDEYRRKKPSTTIDDLPSRDSAPLPQEIASSNDAADRLDAALDQLKPTHREIVRWRLHGLPIAEIAASMLMSEDAVKNAHRRAFQTLRHAPGVTR